MRTCIFLSFFANISNHHHQSFAIKPYSWPNCLKCYSKELIAMLANSQLQEAATDTQILHKRDIGGVLFVASKPNNLIWSTLRGNVNTKTRSKRQNNSSILWNGNQQTLAFSLVSYSAKTAKNGSTSNSNLQDDKMCNQSTTMQSTLLGFTTSHNCTQHHTVQQNCLAINR